MKPSLQVRLSQHLALTPQLQQSIRLLQLSTLELHQEVEQMLEQNPFLDTEEEGGSALDVSEAQPPPAQSAVDVLSAVPMLSPLAWLLSYQYPVHRIGPSFRPAIAGPPTYLLVYRDRQEKVRFMELNAVSARLVELARDNAGASGAQLLQDLAVETAMEAAMLTEFGASQLAELYECSVLGQALVAPANQ